MTKLRDLAREGLVLSAMVVGACVVVGLLLLGPTR